MEMAQDDNLAGPQIVAFYDALKAAGYKPEFHIYEHGGHGWSMRKHGTTSVTGSTSFTGGSKRTG